MENGVDDVEPPVDPVFDLSDRRQEKAVPMVEGQLLPRYPKTTECDRLAEVLDLDPARYLGAHGTDGFGVTAPEEAPMEVGGVRHVEGVLDGRVHGAVEITLEHDLPGPSAIEVREAEGLPCRRRPGLAPNPDEAILLPGRVGDHVSGRRRSEVTGGQSGDGEAIAVPVEAPAVVRAFETAVPVDTPEGQRDVAVRTAIEEGTRVAGAVAEHHERGVHQGDPQRPPPEVGRLARRVPPAPRERDPGGTVAAHTGLILRRRSDPATVTIRRPPGAPGQSSPPGRAGLRRRTVLPLTRLRSAPGSPSRLGSPPSALGHHSYRCRYTDARPRRARRDGGCGRRAPARRRHLARDGSMARGR